MHMSEEEQSQIKRLVAEAEAGTEIQVLTVIVARAETMSRDPLESVRNRLQRARSKPGAGSACCCLSRISNRRP